jgi:hypothetical protein
MMEASDYFLQEQVMSCKAAPERVALLVGESGLIVK